PRSGVAILAPIQRRYSIPFGSDRHGRPLRGSLAMTTTLRVEGRHPPVICEPRSEDSVIASRAAAWQS
ncbi:MAG: hypothetical protein ACYCYG_04905, partial [Bellilinea sp.]